MFRAVLVNTVKTRRVQGKRIVRAARMVLRGEGCAGADVTIICVGNRRCRAINKKFLRHDRTTDVISFTLEEEPALEGEIYVNVDQAALQAAEYRVTLHHEITRLTIHGTLHLLGYDDSTARNRKAMKEKEEAYLAKSGAVQVL